MEKRRLIKAYKNGNKVWGVTVPCMKCNGGGIIPQFYHVASGTCFDCNGTGWVEEKEYEYTPENLAKMEAKLAKKAEKAAEEAAKREAERLEREAEWKRQEAEREAKRRGHYFGTVGDKVEIEVTYMGCFCYSTNFGYTTIYKLDTDDGAHLVWKTGGNLGGDDRQILEGDRIKIRATIKAHKEYHGVEQTELQRVKVLDGGVIRRNLTREQFEEADKLAHDYGGESDEYQNWLRETYLK